MAELNNLNIPDSWNKFTDLSNLKISKNQPVMDEDMEEEIEKEELMETTPTTPSMLTAGEWLEKTWQDIDARVTDIEKESIEETPTFDITWQQDDNSFLEGIENPDLMGAILDIRDWMPINELDTLYPELSWQKDILTSLSADLEAWMPLSVLKENYPEFYKIDTEVTEMITPEWEVTEEKETITPVVEPTTTEAPTFSEVLTRQAEEAPKFARPVTRAVATGLTWVITAAEALTDLTTEWANFLTRLTWLWKERQTKQTISENVLDFWTGTFQGWFVWAFPAMSIFFEWLGEHESWEAVLNKLGEWITAWWEIITKVPWLSDFRESLPEDKREDFDAFIWQSALLFWPKILKEKAKLNKAVQDTISKYEQSSSKALSTLAKWGRIWLSLPWKAIKWAKDIALLPVKWIQKFKNAIFPAETLNEIVWKIVQWEKKNLSKAKKSLELIDTKEIKNYWELSEAFDTKIKQISEKQNKILSTEPKFKPTELETVSEKGTLKKNFVEKWIKDLEELYTTIDDINWLEKIKELKTKDLLSEADINNLAREYNVEFWNKAFRQNWEPVTSINWQSFETTRKEIKKVLRERLPDDTAKILDSEMHNLYDTIRLIKKVDETVFKLWNKVKKRWILEKTWRWLGKIIDISTWKFLSSFLTSVLPSNIWNKVMNSLDLQSSLSKNLKSMNKLLEKSDTMPKSKFKQSLDKIIKEITIIWEEVREPTAWAWILEDNQ